MNDYSIDPARVIAAMKAQIADLSERLALQTALVGDLADRLQEAEASAAPEPVTD